MKGTVPLRTPETPDLDETAPKPDNQKSVRVPLPPEPPVSVQTKPANPQSTPFTQPDGVLARKIRRGRVEVDARLDLHGMRQSEAHAALDRFIALCVARGRRCALIITGKGGRREPQWENDGPFTSSRTEDGVLRRQVPLWLAQEPVCSKILTVESAHQRDGGSGAYYVFLRKNKSGL